MNGTEETSQGTAAEISALVTSLNEQH
ncbi:MAG: hypothetical protein ACPHOJ_04870, partial [Litorivicinaceae bacterium]